MSDCALKSRIGDAMKAAMKAREKERLGTIRLIQSEMKRIEVDERIELDDARVVAVLERMRKQRKDSITQYEAAGRQELADVEAREITINGLLREVWPRWRTKGWSFPCPTVAQCSNQGTRCCFYPGK